MYLIDEKDIPENTRLIKGHDALPYAAGYSDGQQALLSKAKSIDIDELFHKYAQYSGKCFHEHTSSMKPSEFLEHEMKASEVKPCQK